jgi:enamine deaminase RidA (YjgF/YER057c/UK114 family)
LGVHLTTEEGKLAARSAAIDLLATLHHELQDLEKVKRIRQDAWSGASELLQEVFGGRGRHARSSFGVAQIPMGSCVEI